MGGGDRKARSKNQCSELKLEPHGICRGCPQFLFFSSCPTPRLSSELLRRLTFFSRVAVFQVLCAPALWWHHLEVCHHWSRNYWVPSAVSQSSALLSQRGGSSGPPRSPWLLLGDGRQEGADQGDWEF